MGGRVNKFAVISENFESESITKFCTEVEHKMGLRMRELATLS